MGSLVLIPPATDHVYLLAAVQYIACHVLLARSPVDTYPHHVHLLGSEAKAWIMGGDPSVVICTDVGWGWVNNRGSLPCCCPCCTSSLARQGCQLKCE